MRIGTLAQRSGIAVETLRYYEKQGLITAPPRSAAAIGLRKAGASNSSELTEVVAAIQIVRQSVSV